MNRRHIVRSAYTAIAGLCLLASVSCGGGGGGGGVIVTPDLDFVPDNATPAANTVSMQAGASTLTDFNVEIRVTNIDDFFGAAFHVKFNPAVATFDTASTTGSVLGNPPPQFDVADLGGGELAVVASLQGAVAGIPNATGLLVTLHFASIAETTNSAFTFTPTASRSVQVCPTAGGACSEVQGSLSWSGGKLTVVN
jgi:hypothetical protein